MSLFNTPRIAGWPGHNAISHAADWTNQLAKGGRGGITWVTRHVPMQRWEKDRGGRRRMEKERARVINLLESKLSRLGVWVAFSLAS